MAVPASEREKVDQALDRLPPGERQKHLRQAASNSLEQLPPDERDMIENFAKKLSKDIRGLGPVGALEIIAAVGRRLSTG